MKKRLRWLVIVLALAEAGWMAFDGTRALIMGDYVTPATGDYAGQLGPWAGLVTTIGVEPRSTLMKSVFVVYGGLWLVIIGGFAAGQSWAWLAMIIAATGALWYLPVGTLFSLIQLPLLWLVREHS